jgi:hypothetical protein
LGLEYDSEWQGFIELAATDSFNPLDSMSYLGITNKPTAYIANNAEEGTTHQSKALK